MPSDLDSAPRPRAWLSPGRRSRRLLIALGVYLVVAGINLAVAPRARLLEHTSFNHFALLADAWLHGRLSLEGSPPGYAQNNDFALYDGKWFVAFPPFPAVLIAPLVAFAGGVDNVRDGQFFIWLSGIGPAVLFLALEKLRRLGLSERSERTNAVLALLFAFGTVYFFTAVQGTVWFAAHVVGVALGALYLLFALGAERPLLAGLMVGLGYMSRSPLIFSVPFFAVEALRVSARDEDEPPSKRWLGRAFGLFKRADKKRLLVAYVWFSLPILACIALSLWNNYERFGNAFDFGYEHLKVYWQARMKKWGLFNYHFLSKNLGVVLTNLPWRTPGKNVPFQINSHGLALWFTTPLYLWLLWPKRVRWIEVALYLTVLAVALPTLFYQNTGWVQFGYRFSNDYAVFLFALLATTARPFGALFWLMSVWSVAVNAFGAATFDHGQFRKFYYEDRSQRVFYQPD